MVVLKKKGCFQSFVSWEENASETCQKSKFPLISLVYIQVGEQNEQNYICLYGYLSCKGSIFFIFMHLQVKCCQVSTALCPEYSCHTVHLCAYADSPHFDLWDLQVSLAVSFPISTARFSSKDACLSVQGGTGTRYCTLCKMCSFFASLTCWGAAGWCQARADQCLDSCRMLLSYSTCVCSQHQLFHRFLVPGPVESGLSLCEANTAMKQVSSVAELALESLP